MKLRVDGAPALGRLLLKRSKGVQSAGGGEHSLDGVDAERADQLAFEIGDADEDLVEDVSEDVRLVLVAESAYGRSRREARNEAADCMRAADRNDLDSLRGEVAVLAAGKPFENRTIADAFDGDEKTRVHD